MAKTPENNQIRRDRRNVIAILRIIGRKWMHGKELFLVVIDANPDLKQDLFEDDLDYLWRKGYVEYKGDRNLTVRTINTEDCLFRLTPKGMDLADGIVEDPTLDV